MLFLFTIIAPKIANNLIFVEDFNTMNKLLTLLFISFFSFSHAQKALDTLFTLPPTERVWIDSVYQSLSRTERIGQLLMVRANNAREPYFAEIKHYIKKYGIGGVC